MDTSSSRDGSTSQVHLPHLFFQALLCLALVIGIVVAADFDLDGLDDDWENANGFSGNPIASGNLAGWWQANETNSISLLDRSSYANSLTAVNFYGSSSTNGIFHNAIHFNGTNSYLQAATNALYSAGQFTFSAWVRTDAAPDNQVIAAWTDPNGLGWKLGTATDGSSLVQFDTTVASGQVFVSTNSPPLQVKDAAWHHVALTYTTGQAKVYVDGSLEIDATVSGALSGQAGDFKIGAGTGTGQFWKGDIDEMRYYNRVLSAVEITQLPETYSDPDGDGAVNADEQEHGTNPHDPDTDDDGILDWVDPFPLDFFNNTLPNLSIYSGNNQSTGPSAFLPSPLVVEVRDLNYQVLPNAPVKFTLVSGGGKLSQTQGGQTVTTPITVVADANGRAQVWFYTPDTLGTSCTIKAEAGTGSLLASVLFTASTTYLPPTNGLQLWVKADGNLTKDGSNLVSTWSDESGNGNNATASGTARPLYVASALNGKPVLRFDGSDDRMSVPHQSSLSPSQITLVVVGKRTTPIGDWAMFLMKGGWGAGYAMGGLADLTPKHFAFWANTYTGVNAGDARVAASTVNDSYKFFLGRYNQVAAELWIDGSLAASKNQTIAISSGTGVLGIGSYSTGSYHLNGDIAEILIYNRAITDAEKTDIQAYIYSKYNVGSAPQTPTPTVNPPGATFTAAPTVNLSGLGTIRYTLNDTAVTTSSLIYTNGVTAITAPNGTVVRAKGYGPEGWAESVETRDVYQVDAGSKGIPGADQLSLSPGQSRAGLRLWLRSDFGVVTNSALVSQWTDQSGQRSHATQGTSAYQPSLTSGSGSLSSVNVVRFSSASSNLLQVANVAGLNPAQPTVIVVGKYTSGGSADGVFVAKAATAWNSGYGLTRKTSAQEGYFVQSTSYRAQAPGGDGLAQDVYASMLGQNDGTNVKYFRNGIEKGSVASPGSITHTSGPLELGGQAGVSKFLSGDIVETMVYDRTLTAAERANLHAYFYYRYGIGNQPALTLSHTGGIYTSSQSVTITGFPGAEIRYTLDGSAPTAGSTLYASAILISSPATIRAKAFLNGRESSEVKAMVTVDPISNGLPRNHLRLWLRADAGVTMDGSNNVSQWMDQSLSGNTASQGTGANQPNLVASGIDGKPTLSFNGSSDVLSVADNSVLRSTAQTVVVIGKYASGGSANGVFAAKSNTGWTSGYGLSRKSGAQEGFFAHSGVSYRAQASSGDGLAQDVFALMQGQYNDNDTVKYFRNGVEKASIAIPAVTDSTGPFEIGGQAGGSNYLSGEIAEVLVYEQVLSDADRAHVEAYAYYRYGLGSQPAVSFSPNGGLFSNTVSVTLSGYAGASIQYKIDSGSWTNYAGPINISATSTVYAKASLNGRESIQTQATFTKDANVGGFSKTGLQLWLRADLGLTVDGSNNVSAWADQSGQGRVASQSTGANQPNSATGSGALAGVPVISFNGTSDLLQVADHASLKSNTPTVVVVGKYGSGGSTDRVFVAKAATPWNTGYGLVRPSTAREGFFIHSTSYFAQAPSGDGLAQDTCAVMAGFNNGTNVKYFRNGVQKGSVASPVGFINQSSGPLEIGGQAGISKYLAGEIAEVLVYDQALSDTDRQNLEKYLYYRYGIGTQPTVSMSLTSGLYGNPQVVTASGAYPGAVYYYKIGSGSWTATAADGTFTVSTSGTVRVKATLNGHDSAETTADIVIDPQAAGLSKSGLKLWLRADSGVTVDGSSYVTNWNDQSGTGNHGTASGTAKPLLVTNTLNGQSVLRFDGNDYLSVPDHASLKPAQITVIAVGKQTVNNWSGFAIKTTSTSWNNGYGMMILPGSGLRGFWANHFTNGGTTGNFSQNTNSLLIGSYNLQQVRYWINGTEQTPKAYTSAISHATTPLYIGSQAGSYGVNGDIAEVLIYDRVLTDSERKEIEGYVYARYAVGVQPPLDPPTFTPDGGTFASTTSVTMQSPSPGASIRYLITDVNDATEPTELSALYTGAVLVPSSPSPAVVKAKSFKTGFAASPTATTQFVINSSYNISRNGLKLWLRADAGVKTQPWGLTNIVNKWSDQSGLGHHALQTNQSAMPISTNFIYPAQTTASPTLRFNGSVHTLHIPDSTSFRPSAPSVYVVTRYEGGVHAKAALLQKTSGQTNGFGMSLVTSTNAGFWANHHTNAVSAPFNTNYVHLLYGQYDSAYLERYYRQGQDEGNRKLTSAISYGTSSPPVEIGGSPASTNQWYKGDIAEILVYDRTLTFQERITIENYLGGKYGVTSDVDGDRLTYGQESILGTDPNLADTNGDGLADADSIASGYNPVSTDVDGDGLSNAAELAAGTNPFWADSDGDGVSDGADAFPLDPTRSSQSGSGGDTTPPTINLAVPNGAILTGSNP